MASYRNISISFWTDSKVDDDFTPEDKYFYLYLLTNPHTNICGCYEISMKQMERETGYNIDTVKRLLRRMESVHNVIRYSDKTKEILIINWGRYNWSASEKVKKAVLAVSEHIKHEPFKRYVIDMVSIGYTYDMVPSVTDTVTDTGTDTVTVSETETENRDSACAPSQSPEKQKRFKAPTIEEITAYCQEIGSKVNPQRFFDYYTSNGWKVGRNPMKDWKATIRRWSDDEKPSQGTKNSSIDLSEAEKLFNSF